MNSEGVGDRTRSRFRSFVMGWLVTGISYLGLEIALILCGFHYSRFPQLMLDGGISSYIAWQNANRPMQHFVPDRERMWTAKPNVGNVNAAGYQGPLVPLEKTPDRLRILFVGDSCTNSGTDQYPEMLVAALRERGIDAEALIAGVGGYSTYQGLRFLRKSLRYRPDVVVAYFGWNDHWLGPAPDNAFRPLTDFEILTYQTVGRLRTYQLIHYFIHPPPTYAGETSDFEALLEHLRVPPHYYKRNVRQMIEATREQRIPILFVAAPAGTNIREVERNASFPADLIPVVHDLYRKLLREVVSSEAGAHLIDFDPPDFAPSRMRDDGIHPNRDGYAVIAARILEVMLREVPLDSWRANPVGRPARPDA